MDQETLVADQITSGQELLDRLADEGVAVTGAGWLKESESGQWFLYLVTPLVGEGGARRPAYRRVNTVIRQMPQPFIVDPLEIKVLGPDKPLGKTLSELSRRLRGPSRIRYGSDQLGGLGIEKAHVYAQLAPAD